jgi:hypothetical protein
VSYFVTAFRPGIVLPVRPFISLGCRAAQGVRHASLASLATLAVAASPAAGQNLQLRLQDYSVAPMTGVLSGTNNDVYLARINFMAEEPGGDRFFVNDLNGPLYIVDKTTKQFTQYLDFNGRDGRAGMYEEFVFSSGFANGLITFQFDPDYQNNGTFYTVHMEQPSAEDGGPFAPQHTATYPTSTPQGAPTTTNRQTVLVEWTDTDIGNNTFEGSAREIFRMNMSGQIHPMGDLIFNPNAAPGDTDWRVMYISIGDGGAGENTGSLSTRRTPQRLDSLGGKVLRIIPDLDWHADTSAVSPNGRYRIPNDNPFTSIDDSRVRDEVFALGLRNPHRISWDGPTDTIIVNDIGLHTWEEVNIIHAGGNYGYSEREGNQSLSDDNDIGPIPSPDVVPLRITNTATSGTATPLYPVIQYGHGLGGQPDPAGDSITSGYVYRGTRIPELAGKYIFGDITTGQLMYADFDEMLAADDGDPNTMADVHFIDVLWDNPNDALGEQLYTTITPGGAVLGPMHQIVEKGYEARGGQDPNLPGGASVTGSFGRADIRLQIDEAGELYILSKSDGMIRALFGTQPELNADFDGDGAVDAADFLIWQRGVGAAGGLAQGDADGDGQVTAADLAVWQQQFGAGPGGAAIPEPSAWALALLAWPASRRQRAGAAVRGETNRLHGERAAARRPLCARIM